MSEKVQIGILVALGIYGSMSLLAITAIIVDMAGMSHRYLGDFLVPVDMRSWVAAIAGIGVMALTYRLFNRSSIEAVKEHSEKSE
jgi:hypothetical protein